MSFKKVMVASAVAVGVLVSSVASATTLSTRTFVNNVLVAQATEAVLGTVSTSGTFGGFTVNATGVGEPTLPMPSFTGINSTVSGQTAGSVRIEFSQSNVTKASVGNVNLAALISTITSNTLVGGTGVTSISVSHYANASNVLYDTTGSLIASATFNPLLLVDTFGPVVGIADLTAAAALFSQTIVMDVVFNGTAFSQVQLTSQIISGVPEPATLGLLGLALAGFGVARRRRA